MDERTDDKTNKRTNGWMGHMKKLHEKQPRRPLIYCILGPSLFETSNKISRRGFTITTILFFNFSSWLSLGS